MANSAEQVIETVRLTTAAQNGTVVQVTGTGTVGAATTALAGVVTSSMNLASGSPANVVLVGVTSVLCVTGLTIVPGVTTLWLSSTAGKATTDPSTGIFLGVAIDASKYATKSLVSVWITASGSGSGSSAVTATWPLTTTRYYAVDYNNGDDNNQGYSDVSMAAAGLVAVKTLTRLRAILPDLGDGRNFVVAVAGNSDGTDLQYLKPDGVTLDNLDLSGVNGYRFGLIRTTTNFVNDTADKKLLAPATGQAGPNGDGSWTVAAAPAPTSNVFSVASGTLNAEPGLNGMRVRWLTGALAGQQFMLQRNTSTQITTSRAFTAAPVAGDTFMIERPGVSVDSININSNFAAGGSQPDISQGPVYVVGFRARQTSGKVYTLASLSAPITFSFVEYDAFLTSKSTGQTNYSRQYADEGNVFQASGCGVRHNQLTPLLNQMFTEVNQLLNYQDCALLSASANISVQRVASMLFGPGCYINTSGFRLDFVSCGATRVASASLGLGGTGAVGRMALVGRIGLSSSCISVQGIDYGSAGANPVFLLTDAVPNEALRFSDLYSTAGGNTDVVIDATNMRAGAIGFGTNLTGSTATAGDVRTGGGTIVPFTSFASTALVVDNLGNEYRGATGVDVTRKTPGIFYNVPILTVDPTTPLDGDCWITNIAGTRSFCARIGGTTYRTTLT